MTEEKNMCDMCGQVKASIEATVETIDGEDEDQNLCEFCFAILEDADRVLDFD